MRKILFPVALVATSFAITPAAQADNDIGKVVTGVAQALLQQEVDKAAYIEAQRINTVESYRNYLAKFPKGIYVGNAQQALAKLGAKPVVVGTPAQSTSASSAAQAEAALGLSRTQRVTIQQRLTRLGYDTRGADGLWGSGTRGALSRWQAANGFAATGYITGPQVERIADQAAGKTATTTPAATDAGTKASLEERLLSLTASERREIQLRLTVLGYDTKGTDGVFGANTRRAIARWQGDNGLSGSGYLNADQLQTLKTQSKG